MGSLEHGESRRRVPEIGGRRAQVPGEEFIVVTLESLPSHLREALDRTEPGAGPGTGAWVTSTTESGTTQTVSGHPDAVSDALRALHPSRHPSISPVSTRGATSRRARP